MLYIVFISFNINVVSTPPALPSNLVFSQFVSFKGIAPIADATRIEAQVKKQYVFFSSIGK